jgi:hypothetical protein
VTGHGGEGQSADALTGASPTPLDAAPRQDAAGLTFPCCDACGDPLTPQARAVVDVAEASRRAARMRQWRTEGGLGPRPPLTPWRLLCAKCAAGRDKRSTFSVAVDRLRTDRRLLRQTLRITAKPWAAQTGWATLVLRILGAQ